MATVSLILGTGGGFYGIFPRRRNLHAGGELTVDG